MRRVVTLAQNSHLLDQNVLHQCVKTKKPITLLPYKEVLSDHEADMV